MALGLSMLLLKGVAWELVIVKFSPTLSFVSPEGGIQYVRVIIVAWNPARKSVLQRKLGGAVSDEACNLASSKVGVALDDSRGRKISTRFMSSFWDVCCSLINLLDGAQDVELLVGPLMRKVLIV